MKKLLALLLAMLMVFSLTACNNGGNNGGSEEPAGKTTVTIWHSYTEGQKDYLEKAVADFNASQDQYEVVAESQPKDGLADKIYQAVMAGNGPDMYFDYASTAARYVEDDKVVDLSQYISPDIIAQLPEAVYQEATSFPDGKLHHLPMVSSGPVFFYNKAVYEELGLTAPQTWAELIDNCRKVMEAHPELEGAFAIDSPIDVANTLIFQTGNKQYDPATKEILFNTPEVAAQFQMVADAFAEGLFTDVSGLNDGYCSSAYNNEQIVSFIGSVAGLPYVGPDKGGPEVAFGIVPQGGKVEWAPAWNRGMMIFNYGDENRIKAAAAFTEYFAQPEVNAGWCEAVKYPALFPWTMETETYKNLVASNEIYNYLNASVAGAPSATDNQIIRDAMKNLMAAVQGGTPVQEALDAAVSYIQEELAAQ